jgi:hypothetical protein
VYTSYGKLSKISYIGTLLKVWLIQNSCLFRALSRQVSLYKVSTIVVFRERVGERIYGGLVFTGTKNIEKLEYPAYFVYP